MMLLDVADILRGAGLKVIETPGWKTRGHGQMAGVRGVLWHHTATSAKAAGDYPSQNIVTNGRSDLPGPLCNLGLGRSGTWYVIAAGLAYHAGSGSYPGVGSNGNAYLIGIEAEHPGTPGTSWPAAQLDSYRRGTAALLKAFNLGAERCIAHREWAPTRKIDPYGLDMRAERAHVANYMRGPAAPAPGGLETLAFNDTFTTRYNKQLSVADYMAWTDFRLNEIYRALLEPGSQPSRIPGDKNVTNLRDAVMDSTAWSNITMREVFALKAAVASLGGIDPAKVAEAMRPVLAEVVGPVVRESVTAALGEDNTEQAEAIVREIAQRLSGQEAAE